MTEQGKALREAMEDLPAFVRTNRFETTNSGMLEEDDGPARVGGVGVSLIDRSRDVSDALTEVRTVLSRAESAIDRINSLALVQTTYAKDPNSWRQIKVPYEQDPDREDMVLALERVVHELARWRKAGKGRRQ